MVYWQSQQLDRQRHQEGPAWPPGRLDYQAGQRLSTEPGAEPDHRQVRQNNGHIIHIKESYRYLRGAEMCSPVPLTV